MPRYRENPLIIPFSMLCPGISQNTKHHHLTLYKGQVWGEKSYLELCNHNVLNVAYDRSAIYHDDILEQNGELFVTPVPGWGFINDAAQIPWDSEILQSFAELTNITNILNKYVDIDVMLYVGSWNCYGVEHYQQCVPPYRYYPWYIWTKEGLKIQIKVFRFKIIISLISIF